MIRVGSCWAMLDARKRCKSTNTISVMFFEDLGGKTRILFVFLYALAGSNTFILILCQLRLNLVSFSVNCDAKVFWLKNIPDKKRRKSPNTFRFSTITVCQAGSSMSQIGHLRLSIIESHFFVILYDEKRHKIFKTQKQTNPKQCSKVFHAKKTMC